MKTFLLLSLACILTLACGDKPTSTAKARSGYLSAGCTDRSGEINRRLVGEALTLAGAAPAQFARSRLVGRDELV